MRKFHGKPGFFSLNFTDWGKLLDLLPLGLWRLAGFIAMDSDVTMEAQEVLKKLPQRQNVQQALHGVSWLQGCRVFFVE